MNPEIIFESYEREFKQLIETVDKQVRGFFYQNSGNPEQIIENMRKMLNQAQENQMEIECARYNWKLEIKKNLKQKAQQYKNQYDDVRQKFLKLEDLFQEKKKKAAILQVDQKVDDYCFIKQQSNTMTNLDKQNQQLANTNRMLVSIDDMGNNIQKELFEQRENLLKANDDVKDIQYETTKADRIITLMKNKLVFNKLILVLIAFMIGFTDFVLIYMRIKHLFS